MFNGGLIGKKNDQKTALTSGKGVWTVDEQYTFSKAGDWPSVVTNGLGLWVDATNPASYRPGSTTWYDLSGNGLHLTGNASYMSTFDGLRSGSVWQTAATSLLNTDTHSIFFYIRFNSTDTYPQATSGSWEKILGYEPSGTDRSPGIWRFPSDRFIHWRYDPGNLGPNIGSTDVPATNDGTPSTPFVLNTWYYIGVVKNGGTATTYINGQAIGTSTVANPKTAGTSAITLFPGYTLASANLDNIQVYNRAISSTEVMQNYNASKGRWDRIPAAFLVVGGGGGGGMDMGGGGGAGGYVAGTTVLAPGTYRVCVGEGGSGAPAGSTNGQSGGHQFSKTAGNGRDSYLYGVTSGTILAKGGGYGGSSYWQYTPNWGYGNTGGSGGGSSGFKQGVGTSVRAGRSTQADVAGYGKGNVGGQSTDSYYSGGGGGAGAAGNTSDASVQADGGIGILNDILGTNYYWAGGGGGAGYSREGGNGGAGGGGAGAVGTKTGGSGFNAGQSVSGGAINSQANVPGGNGGANTGGGGGGGSHYNATNKGGDGGSGIVVLRYPDWYPDLVVSDTLTYVRTTHGASKVYRFLSGRGTITFGVPPTATQTIVTSSLRLHLDPRSYPGSGTTWPDSSGNGSNATLVNAPAFTSYGYFSFIAGKNQYVSCGNFGTFPTQGTISFWMYSEDAANYRNILHSHFQGVNAGFRIEQVSPSHLGMLFGTDASSYTGHTLTSTGNTANEWRFITITWNTATNNTTGYINGTQVFNEANTTWPTQLPSLTLGGGFNSDYNRWFAGRLGQVLLYTKQLSAAEVLQNFNATKERYMEPETPAKDGLSAVTAGDSAQQLKQDYGYDTDGVYWINIPAVGPTQVYCIMNSAIDGGGWMMAMKATRGTTFNYDSTHWTTPTTLNEGQVNRNDGDAKFWTMNRMKAKDILAIWPDITTQGGSLNVSGYNWTWLENNFNGGVRTHLIDFFANTVGTVSAATGQGLFIRDAKTFSGWASGIFSSQVDIRFYGFNYKAATTPYNSLAKVRWGFGWNENGEGLFPGVSGAANGSNDVAGGIGISTEWGGYSGGDVVRCCQDTTGINRSARVEVYIR